MESVILENNKEYLILNKIKNGSDKYIYLVNTEDPKDFCIRKSLVNSEKEVLIGLKDEEEFRKALLLFNKNLKKD